MPDLFPIHPKEFALEMQEQARDKLGVLLDAQTITSAFSCAVTTIWVSVAGGAPVISQTEFISLWMKGYLLIEEALEEQSESND